MDYKQALRTKMEQYYQLTVEYQAAITDAAMTAKKRGLFKKVDLSFQISEFRQLAVKAEKFLPEDLAIPEEDTQSANLAELMRRSINAFILLCEANAAFYDVVERKQYRSNKVPLKEYADATGRMQGCLEGAVKEMEQLEQAYKQYSADNFTD